VPSEVAADQDDVTGPGPARSDVDAGTDEPESRRVHVDAVAVPGVDDLGVTGDQPHPCRPGRCAQGLGDAPEVGQRRALLQDEGRREVERLRA
jgi:hypothetical protein